MITRIFTQNMRGSYVKKVALSIFIISILITSILPLTSINAEQTLDGEWISETTYEETLPDGRHRVTIYSSPVAYFDENTKLFKLIETSLAQNSTHYLVDRASYHVYFSKSLTSSCLVTLTRNTSYICWKPINSGYLDVSNHNTRSIRNLNTSASIVVSGNTITYVQIFGRGIDLKFTVGTNTLKEELIISESIVSNLPNPSVFGMLPSDTYVGVVSSYQTNLDIDGISISYSTIDQVNLKDGGVIQFILPPSSAWDSQIGELGEYTNTIKVRNFFLRNDGLKIGSGVPYNWIKDTEGEVVIDPTTTIQPPNQDGSINSGAAGTNYAGNTALWVRTLGGGDLRALVDFTWAIPVGSVIDSANVSLYYYAFAGAGGDPVGRTYDVHILTGVSGTGWLEASLSWNNYKVGNAWTTAGGDYSGTDMASQTVPAGFGWMNWTVTNMIQNYVNNGTSTSNMIFKDNAESGADLQSLFYSADYGVDITKRPTLVIEYTVGVVSLNLNVLAADESTSCTTLTSECYITLTNSSGSFKVAVSSGWANFTDLNQNEYHNITLQAYNTSNINSFILVNSSNSVNINVTTIMNRVLIGSIYQNVTLSFNKDDDTSFTPTAMSITFGNNGTTVNVATDSIFVNGSNTINSITWQGDNVKNATTTFEVTSYNQDLVFEGRIYIVTPSALDVNSNAVSSGITGNITMNNAGSNTTSLSQGSSFYIQNGSIITTTWWRGILVNTTATFTITTNVNISINAQIGSDSYGYTRFAEGTSTSGVNSMMIEGLAANYQLPPISLTRNITVYSSSSLGWNYTASLNLLNLTLTNMKSLTNLSSININIATSLVSFNTTGSGMTYYSVSYNIYSQLLTSFGASFYDNADHYQDNTFLGTSEFNLLQPWSNYNSSDCFSANIIQYSKVPYVVPASLPNAIGIISDANTGSCKNVEGRIMATVKLNTTSSILNSVFFNYSIVVPTGVNGSYYFVVAYTYNTPTAIGSVILNQTITTSINGSTVLYFSSTNNQIIWVQFILQATPGNHAAYTDGCSFSTFSNGVCVTLDEIYITNAGGYIYPHNFNIAWAYNYNWFNVVAYPTTISINYPATLAFTDLQYVPVPTPDRFLPLEFSNLITVFITATSAPGYYRTMIPTGLATGNQTIHIDDPSIVNQIVLQINDLTSKFPVGSEIYISRSGLPITSGYMGEGNLFTAWLTPASYSFTLISGSASYTSTINVPAASTTIVVYIAVSEITTPASDSSSISYSVVWNEGTNNTVQVTYNDLTAGTTAITFNLYTKNSTCPTGCIVSTVSAPPGTYSTYTDQLPANYADLNTYYVEIVSTHPAFGTNTFGPISIGKLNLPIGHIEPPSMDGLGFTPYISSWITIFDLLSFFVIIVTAGLFTKKDGSIAMIAIALEGAFFTSISVYAAGEITWTHITPGFFAIIGCVGVFMYLRQKETTK